MATVAHICAYTHIHTHTHTHTHSLADRHRTQEGKEYL